MLDRVVAAAALVLALGGPARADGEGERADDAEQPHYAMALGWAAVVMGIPGAYYWNTQGLQEVDWTMRWDWASWEQKLFGTGHLKFDTNAFTVNALRHPLTGWADYQIARSNGFGPLGSEVFAFAAGVFWEYVVEYPEDPSINDLIMNPIGGIAIGEPLYQLGQIWRGGVVSVGDRVRTLLFSPFDATQDLWRPQPRWYRPRVWRDFAVSSGGNLRRVDDGTLRRELVVRVDLDLVNHPGYLVPGVRADTTEVGAWSRVAVRFGFGDPSDEKAVATVAFHSRTSISGRYEQDADGDGTFLGVGSAFTYRRERMAAEWDRVALAHLLGPQLQRVWRSPERTVRWDLAAYGDFALIQAEVLGPVSMLAAPPPIYSTAQVAGYYDGLGASVFTRLRVDDGPWHADLELTGHQVWQINCCDRAPAPDATPVRVPHGIDDSRLYWRGTVGYRPGSWGLGLELGGAYRRGGWAGFERSTTERDLALVAQLEL